MIVADNETTVDLLYFDPIARTVVRLLRENSDQPLSVGIHGDWGAGKSSILLMIEKEFENDERVVCVRFNGWLFQGFADAKAILIETIVSELGRHLPRTVKIKEQIEKVLRRVEWMKIARGIGSVGLSMATGIPHVDTLKNFDASIRDIIANEGESPTPETLASLAKGSGAILREIEEEGPPEQMHAFREEFSKLLELANIDQLIVLVDDLDRCLPKIAIETLEAIRLFLFVPKAAFVVAADEGMIEYAVRQHFPDRSDTFESTTYARNYLEKLIQVPFRLPSLDQDETCLYVALLLVLIDCGESSDKFNNFFIMVREALHNAWERRSLDRQKIEWRYESLSREAEQALELSSNIAPILADGAHGNPRQIKRFVNTMQLRFAYANERDMYREIDISVLAKIMLAERFAPDFFHEITVRVSSDDGKSAELALLEASIGRGKSVRLGADSAIDEEMANRAEASLPQWPTLVWAKRWAAIDPPLANTDLRPYVYLARDQRSFIGSKKALPHLDLEGLIAKLQGTQMQAAMCSKEVAHLLPHEVEKVFDALCAEVLKVSSLAERPAGVAGLAEVARVHPYMQRALVRFLDELPISKIGPWAASGWGSSIGEADAKRDFEKLIDKWVGQDENVVLKSVAGRALKHGNFRRS